MWIILVLAGTLVSIITWTCHQQSAIQQFTRDLGHQSIMMDQIITEQNSTAERQDRTLLKLKAASENTVQQFRRELDHQHILMEQLKTGQNSTAERDLMQDRTL